MPRERTLACENGSKWPRAKTRSSSSRNTATCSPPTSAPTPALGTMSSSRQMATSCRFKFFFLWPCGPDLAALGHEDHVAIGRVAIHEVAEALEDLRRLDRLLPFALVGLHVPLQLRFQLGANAEPVCPHQLPPDAAAAS